MYIRRLQSFSEILKEITLRRFHCIRRFLGTARAIVRSSDIRNVSRMSALKVGCFVSLSISLCSTLSFLYNHPSTDNKKDGSL